MEPIKLILLAINIKQETTLMSDIGIEDLGRVVVGDVIKKITGEWTFKKSNRKRSGRCVKKV